MTDRTWTVDVAVSTVVRRTITLTVQAPSKDMAENYASDEARRHLNHADHLPAGYRAIRWTPDYATATEVTE